MANNSYEEVLKQTTSSKSIIFQFSKTYPAYIVLIAMIVFSFFVKSFFQDKVTSDNKNEYDKAVTSVLTRFETAKNADLQVLKSMSTLYENLSVVSRDYFFLYGSVPVKTYKSILSIMNVKLVKNTQLGEFEFITKGQGHLDYQVFPKAKKDVYYPVEFIVLDDGNGHKRGLDLGSNPIALSAIEKARDNNTFIATPNFMIRTPDTLGLYIMAPIYTKGANIETESSRKSSFTGLVVLETNIKKLFSDALGEGLPSDKTIAIEIIDKDESGNDQIIFSSKNADVYNNKYKPIETSIVPFKIADREYSIKIQTVPDFGNSFQMFLPTLAFILSIGASVLFFGFILSVTTSRARALDLAERITRSQRRIVEASKDIIGVLTLTGEWKSINPASLEVFGASPNDMIGKNILALLNDEKELHSILNMFENAIEDQSIRLDGRVLVDNSIKWINWNFTVSKIDQLVYLIGRDVTLEKVAEEETKLKGKQVLLAEQFTREASEFKSFFIRKLSHYLRNSLTGTLGYLQLLGGKAYDNEEEMLNYVDLANDSAEELFSFISDMDEVAQYSEYQLSGDMTSIKTYKFIDESIKKLNELGVGDNIQIEISEESRNAMVIGDQLFIAEVFFDLYKALSVDMDKTEILINSQENPYEGATEIQLLSSANPLVAEKIELFKQYKSNLIDSLKFDSDDIILNFATAMSNLRMINGVMTLETLGEDGNLVQIILPSNKKAN